MKSIVVTGGIATGKSSLVRALKERLPALGLFDCDQEVRHLLTQRDILEELRHRFGDRIFSGDGALNRKELRQIVFGSSSRRRELESLLHPLVRARCDEARRVFSSEEPAGIFLADVPLYYETNEVYPSDLVIVVATTPETQRERLMKRNHLSQAEAQRIIDAQMLIGDKVERADLVIWNDGAQEVLEVQADLAASVLAL